MRLRHLRMGQLEWIVCNAISWPSLWPPLSLCLSPCRQLRGALLISIW